MAVACVLPIETSFFNYRSSLKVINSFQVGDIKTLLQEELEVTAGTAVTLRRGPHFTVEEAVSLGLQDNHGQLQSCQISGLS